MSSERQFIARCCLVLAVLTALSIGVARLKRDERAELDFWKHAAVAAAARHDNPYLDRWWHLQNLLSASKFVDAKHRDSAPASILKLHADIVLLFWRSTEECSHFYQDDADCVKKQFAANYRWYVIRDQDSKVGHPGIPGPPGLTSQAPGDWLQ